jgi:hypothetical protein
VYLIDERYASDEVTDLLPAWWALTESIDEAGDRQSC